MSLRACSLGLSLSALHRVLADDLGCHPEAHAAAWMLCATDLKLTSCDLGEPGGWLDSDFSETVPVEMTYPAPMTLPDLAS